jgi:UDP-N-acetylglucosamine 1-carboxyvinyltransferase
MTNLLAHLGVEVTTRQSLTKGRSVNFSAKGLAATTAPYDLVRKMRASVLVLGPLIARHGQAKVSLPGGCAIGTRPVDLLIWRWKTGAELTIDGGYVVAKRPVA